MLASCCLSFLAKQSLSLCSFLCCSLCATPICIALLQLGCSLASCSQFMGLIPHCLRLCLRISLKHFRCAPPPSPSGYISHWLVYCTGSSLGAILVEISKLKSLGTSSFALDWFRSYLKDRRQYVRITLYLVRSISWSTSRFNFRPCFI